MSVPLSKDNAYNGAYMGDRGAEPISSVGTIANSLSLSITKFLSTPINIIYQQIPKTTGVNSTYCYHLLNAVCTHPRRTIGFYCELLKTRSANVKRSIMYLCVLGYVRPVNTPRLQIPFQSYTIDTSYILTPLGRSVLNKLLDY